MDSNAWHTEWGSKECNRRGRRLMEFILRRGLVIANSGSVTFRNAIGESAIDLTLLNGAAAGMLAGWAAAFDTSSDHAVITARLRLPVGAWSVPAARWAFRRADWEAFRAVLAARCDRDYVPELGDAHAIDREVSVVTEAIMDAACRAIPKSSCKRRGVPWWSHDLTRARKSVLAARRLFEKERRRDMRPLLEAAYRLQQRAYRRKISRAKKASWRQFVAETSGSGPWGLPYKVARGLTSIRPAEAAIALGNAPPATIRESRENLLRQFFPWDDEAEDSGEQAEMRARMSAPPDSVPLGSWDEDDLEAVVRKMRSSGAPGPDGITGAMVKAALPVIGSRLLGLYNACLQLGYFPAGWKVAEVKCLAKSADRDMSDPKTYRPICLLSVLGKALEALLAPSIDGAVRGFLSPRQFGGTRGRSTDDAIQRFVDDVRGVREKYAIAIFFDISGAFDSAWWPLILERLRDARLASDAHALVCSFLRDRAARITAGGVEAEVPVNRGTAQGSVSGCRLWNSIFNGVLEVLDAMDVKAVAFVDDLEALAVGDSRAAVVAQARDVVAAVESWAIKSKLSINAGKTVGMVVKGRFDARHPPVIRTAMGRLRVVDRATYLGVTFGSKLVVGPHIDTIAGKIATATRVLNRLASATWGIKYRPRLTVYKGLFEGIILYAAGAWAPLLKRTDRDRLLRIQRTVLIQVSQAYRTVSYEAVQVLCGVPPIDLALEARLSIYRARKSLPQLSESDIAGTAALYPDDKLVRAREVGLAVLRAWQSRWETTTKGSVTKAFFPSVAARIDASWVEVNHWTAQFLTGHGSFSAKLHFFRRSEAADCGSCPGSEEDVWHVLFRCPRYDAARLQLYRGAHNYAPTARDLVETEEAWGSLVKFIEFWRDYRGAT